MVPIIWSQIFKFNHFEVNSSLLAVEKGKRRVRAAAGCRYRPWGCVLWLSCFCAQEGMSGAAAVEMDQ